MLKVQSDIFESMDRQNVTLLVMLDLNDTFDTVSHDVLFTTLEHQFGVSGTVLDWFRSYLNNRKQKVLVNSNLMSAPRDLNCGVPQGSCLGPVLFVLYISSLYDVISCHLPSVHGYAYDHQLYISFKPDPLCTANTVKAMEACIQDVRQWMLINRLMINDSKTEVMLITVAPLIFPVQEVSSSSSRQHGRQNICEMSTFLRMVTSWKTPNV